MCITLVYNQRSLLMTLWNFSSSLWVRATPPSGISPLRQGRIIPDGGADFFIRNFISRSTENIIWIPDGGAKWPFSFVFLFGRSHPWRRGQMLFITISIHPIGAMAPHHPWWSCCPCIRDCNDVSHWFDVKIVMKTTWPLRQGWWGAITLIGCMLIVMNSIWPLRQGWILPNKKQMKMVILPLRQGFRWYFLLIWI